MRLIYALAASLTAHVALLSLPVGHQAYDRLDSGVRKPEPLLADFRPLPGLREQQFPVLPKPTQRPIPYSVPVEPDSGPIDDPSPHEIGIPLPRYYEPREVTERASPAKKIDLESPVLLGIPGQGKLILVLWINEHGAIDRVEVESGKIADAMQTAIVEQFRNAVFTPARLEGRSVKSRMKIEVIVKPRTAIVVPPPPPPRSRPASAAEN